MTIVRPFRAYRPIPELVQRVAALPYDVMNREEALQMAKENPFSFLHVDRAEIDLSGEINPYHPLVYAKAKENLRKMISEQIYFQDSSPYFYIYRLVMNGQAQTGLVCCTSIDEYQQDLIKKHELTRLEKEIDRIHHIDACNAHTGPIFLTYRTKAEINNIIVNWTKEHLPVYDFISEDNITHTVWVLDNQDAIQEIERAFLQVNCLYIADGHHRSASAVKVGLQKRADLPTYTGNEEFNFFLSVIFPDNEVKALDYNRVVKDLNGYSEEEFLQLVAEKFTVEQYDEQPYQPEGKCTFGMYLHNRWYKLTAKSEIYNPHDPVGRLDVSILQENLLKPLLGICDPRTDQRIDFIGGIRGLKELEYRVNTGWKVAFALHPVSVAELMAIADAGKMMPPKSTWFEPKLRSGIFIHMLG